MGADHSGAAKRSCWKEKGSNATQSKNDACSTKRKPHKLKLDEPVEPDVHTAICLKAFDDGQTKLGRNSLRMRRRFLLHTIASSSKAILRRQPAHDGYAL